MRRVLALCTFPILCLTWLVVLASPALAHTPHDAISDVEVAPDFDETGTVFTISRAFLLRSDDRGETWTRLVNGLTQKRSLSSIAMSAADPDVVYVSTRGNGVFRSEDQGDTWSATTVTPEGTNLLSIEASPNDADLVVGIGAAAEGQAVLTRDGGESWTPVDGISRPRSATFAVDDANFLAIGDADGRVHVSRDQGATWTVTDLDGRRVGEIKGLSTGLDFSNTPTIFIATELAGVARSLDGGATVEGGAELDLSGNGLDDLMTIDVLVAGAANGERVWVSTRNEGVYVSDDGGESWRRESLGLTTDEMANRLGASNFGALAAAPTRDAVEPTMFAATFDGLFRTDAVGEPWSYLQTQISTNIAAFDISPDFASDKSIIVASYINGAFRSSDGGETWEHISDGLAYELPWRSQPDYIARLTSISFYPTFGDDERVFVGTRGYYFQSEDFGTSWSVHQPKGILTEEEFPADYLVPSFSPDFADEPIAFLGTDAGKVFRYDGSPDEINLVADIGVQIFTTVVAPGFADNQTVFLGTKAGVFVSTDGGVTFIEAETQVPAEVTSMALSPTFDADGLAWVGTPRGLFVSKDRGVTWSLVPGQAFTRTGSIEAVAVSPDFANDRRLLVTVGGEGLFDSVDGGETFAPLAPQLLEDQVIFSSFYHPTSEPLRFSPTYAEDRTIFGSMSDGLYRSTDAGETWTKTTLPVQLHDVDSDPPLSFIVTARFENPLTVGERPADNPVDSAAFDTPLGRLSPKRVALAGALGLLTLLGLSLPLRPSSAALADDDTEPTSQREGVRTALVARWPVRALGAILVTVAALVVLAA